VGKRTLSEGGSNERTDWEKRNLNPKVRRSSFESPRFGKKGREGGRNGSSVLPDRKMEESIFRGERETRT